MGAIERRESRGAHQRSDYPGVDAALQIKFVVMLTGGELAIAPEPVPEVPVELREWAGRGVDAEAEGRLLE